MVTALTLLVALSAPVPVARPNGCVRPFPLDTAMNGRWAYYTEETTAWRIRLNSDGSLYSEVGSYPYDGFWMWDAGVLTITQRYAGGGDSWPFKYHTHRFRLDARGEGRDDRGRKVSLGRP